jgi:twitching motility protein PilT
MHRHVKSTVNQREVGADTRHVLAGPARALRPGAEGDPHRRDARRGDDRDRHGSGGDRGHLGPLRPLHTIDAAKTWTASSACSPKDQEPQIRTRLSQSFRYVISQRLLPKIGGGRIAALEMLKSTMRTRDYVCKGERRDAR